MIPVKGKERTTAHSKKSEKISENPLTNPSKRGIIDT